MPYISSGILQYLHPNFNLIIDSENFTGRMKLFQGGLLSLRNYFNKGNDNKIVFLLFPNPRWGLGNR